MNSDLQEYLPAMVPAVLGVVAGIAGFFFALRERRERARLRQSEKVRREPDSNLQKTA
jgi:ABC-type xylose transport system permease subunit